MATVAFAPNLRPRLSLEAIDSLVSARLGPTRIPGNEQPACFNRQIAMYLAKHVGGWSTTAIGRFYNGRDHSTVCYGIGRIESLRESDAEVDALLTALKAQLGQEHADPSEPRAESPGIFQHDVDQIADLVAARVCAYLEQRMGRSNN